MRPRSTTRLAGAPHFQRAAAVALATTMAISFAAGCAVPGISMGDSGAAIDGSGSGEGDGTASSGRSLLGCSVKNVGDIADCPGGCNAAIEGAEGVYQCTITCNEVEQDCGEGYFCQVFQDGGTACLEDCSQTRVCSNGDDACDPALSVCLPVAETGGSGDDDDGGSDAVEVSTTCDFGVVESTSDCDDDCDNPVYTGDGLYVCTTACDVEDQDCPGPQYRCEEVDDGTGACFLDCSSGHACPGDDYACHEDLELCIPTR